MCVPGCTFCLPKKEWYEHHRPYMSTIGPDQIVYKWGQDLFLTVDTHQVLAVEQHQEWQVPYFLAVPYQHKTSFALLPRNMETELEALLRYAEFCVRSDRRTAAAKNRILFEHGQSRDGNKVKSIYHAHLHCLFFSMDVEDVLALALSEMSRLGVPYQVVKGEDTYLATLAAYVPEGMDYLYFRVNDVEIVALDDANDRIYSQFFRQILARAYGCEFIDWKTATPEQEAIFHERLRISLPANPASYLK